MKKILATGYWLLATGYFSFAQAPKYSNEFLNIGAGARAFGMSNAYVASVGDATSGYWNPAGLMNVKNDMELALMHSEYFAGIAKYDYGALARKLDSSVIAFSVVRFGVDNIPNTTELIDASGNVDYGRITQFSAADYAFIFSYARLSKIPGLRLGANAKIIRRIVGDFAGAWGFGLDAGAQYDYKGWKFGAMARDVTSTFNAWSFNLSDDMKNTFAATGNEIPKNSVEITLPRLILGAAKKIDITQKISALAEINFDFTFDGMRNVLIKSNRVSADPHLGIEFGYKNLAFLRAGIMNIQQVKDITGKSFTSMQPNIGVGVKIKAFSIDYALADLNLGGGESLLSHFISLKMDINKPTVSK